MNILHDTLDKKVFFQKKTPTLKLMRDLWGSNIANLNRVATKVLPFQNADKLSVSSFFEVSWKHG